MFKAYLIDEYANKHPVPNTGPQIRIERGVLHLTPNHDPVVYDGSLWRNDTVRFVALRIDASAVFHFENDQGTTSKRFGPYSPTMLVNGSIRFGNGDSHAHTAWLDRDKMMWRDKESDALWPIIVLSQSV